MTSREEIRKVAAENGWTLTRSGSFQDWFERQVKLPEDHVFVRMKRAAGVDYPTIEGVMVGYTYGGAIQSGWYAGPGHQAALTGKFAGSDEFLGRGKRAQILARLRRTTWSL